MTVRIKFTASAGDNANATEHEFVQEFAEMPTEEDLDEMAEDHMWETVRPNKGWEIIE